MKVMWAFGVMVFFVGTAGSEAAELRGRVLNAQGEAVVGARVSVSSLARKGRGQGRHEQATTRLDGTFSIGDLEPGPYTVLLSAPAQRVSYRRPFIIRSESQTVQIDFQIPPTPERPLPEQTGVTRP